MKSKRLLKIIVWVTALIVIAAVVLWVIDVYQRPRRVAYMLNIPSLPKSARVVDCKSPFIPTDVVIACSIEIDPRDFPYLLKGYDFTESTTNGTSHSVPLTKVGPEFPIASQFIAHPKEFKDGGAVTIVTDRERKRAVIDYYKE